MIVLNLIQNVALLVALAAAYQVIGSRFEKRKIRHQIVSGLLFGGVGLVGMMTPMSGNELKRPCAQVRSAFEFSRTELSKVF